MDSTSRFDGNVNTPHAELRTKAINAREHGALGPAGGERTALPRRRAAAAAAPRRRRLHDERPARGAGLGARGGRAARARPARRSATLQEAIDAPRRARTAWRSRDSATRHRDAASARATTIRNVVGWIPGRDTTRTLVIGAHYDHLGYGGESSLAPDAHTAARRRRRQRLRAWRRCSASRQRRIRARAAGRAPAHNLVFCAFTGEEMRAGRLRRTSSTTPPRPLETVEAMLNMDMVGRLRDNQLMVMGVGTAAEFPALVENTNRRRRSFDLKTSSDGYGPERPLLVLQAAGSRCCCCSPARTPTTTSRATPGTSSTRPGLARVARLRRGADRLARRAAARRRTSRPRADSVAGRIAGGGGYGAYLGTIPDYMQTEGGVLLSGVRAGSPAEQAGLKGGDIIVRFDGVRVDNIYDYTFALRSRKPGQQRADHGQARRRRSVDLVATLGRRP